MIVCIDMREVNSELIDGSTSRFAFWDCSRAGFIRLSASEAWHTWKSFQDEYQQRYFVGSPYKAPYVLGSFKRACPAWVFEP